MFFEVFPFGFKDEVVEGEEAAKIRKAVLPGSYCAMEYSARRPLTSSSYLARSALLPSMQGQKEGQNPLMSSIQSSNLMTLAALGIKLNRAVDETNNKAIAP